MSVDAQFAKAVLALLADRKLMPNFAGDITISCSNGAVTSNLIIPVAFLDGWITMEENPPIDEQVEQLKAGGWVHVHGHRWMSPAGEDYIGPHGAWVEMKRRQEGK